MGSQEVFPFDVLIVGAGFSGLHSLWKCRNLGLSAKVLEAGSDVGGTWFWNRYPGARVDSEVPTYQLYEEEDVWDFNWTQRFPGREELMKYFHHVESKLGLRKDIQFRQRVTQARFDESENLWHVSASAVDEGNVETGAKVQYQARVLLLCIGFSARRYLPPFKGLSSFKGPWYHSALWPEAGVDLRGKRVSIVGTGATGVQIIQEIGPLVKQLTVYQRTPNLALPMRQCFRGQESEVMKKGLWYFPKKDEYPEIFKHQMNTFTGTVLRKNFYDGKSFSDMTKEERLEVYERVWEYGGFGIWLCGFLDTYFVQEVNDEVYTFWSEKVRARLRDTNKKDAMAPRMAPHPFGVKRPSLEQNYYDVIDQDNVQVVDFKRSPMVKITEKGIETAKEGIIDADVLIFATGFDAITGGLFDINITNGKGQSLEEKWVDGARTYLGMSSAGYPNLFWCYGPQAPTAFSNGPSCGPFQASWILTMVKGMFETGKTKVEPRPSAEEEWAHEIRDKWYNSLFPACDSWYQGANIPGRIREPLNYIQGLPAYFNTLEEIKNEGYRGFIIS